MSKSIMIVCALVVLAIFFVIKRIISANKQVKSSNLQKQQGNASEAVIVNDDKEQALQTLGYQPVSSVHSIVDDESDIGRKITGAGEQDNLLSRYKAHSQETVSSLLDNYQDRGNRAADVLLSEHQASLNLQKPDQLSEDVSGNVSELLKLGEMLAIDILAQSNQSYLGYQLQQVLTDIGFEFGEMNIFHCHELAQADQKQPVISLASIAKPGTFDIETMGQYEGRGLAMFMILKSAGDLEKTFLTMLEKANAIIAELGGEVTQHGGGIITQQWLDQVRSQLVGLQAEQVVMSE